MRNRRAADAVLNDSSKGLIAIARSLRRRSQTQRKSWSPARVPAGYTSSHSHMTNGSRLLRSKVSTHAVPPRRRTEAGERSQLVKSDARRNHAGGWREFFKCVDISCPHRSPSATIVRERAYLAPFAALTVAEHTWAPANASSPASPCHVRSTPTQIRVRWSLEQT